MQHCDGRSPYRQGVLAVGSQHPHRRPPGHRRKRPRKGHYDFQPVPHEPLQPPSKCRTAYPAQGRASPLLYSARRAGVSSGCSLFPDLCNPETLHSC